eukprot:g25535.t1
MRKNFFTQRIVNLWNSLRQKAVGVSSLDTFKRELDVVLELTRDCCGGDGFGFPVTSVSSADSWGSSGVGGFRPTTRPCGISSGYIDKVGLKQTHNDDGVTFGPVRYLAASVVAALARS